MGVWSEFLKNLGFDKKCGCMVRFCKKWVFWLKKWVWKLGFMKDEVMAVNKKIAKNGVCGLLKNKTLV